MTSCILTWRGGGLFISNNPPSNPLGLGLKDPGNKLASYLPILVSLNSGPSHNSKRSTHQHLSLQSNSTSNVEKARRMNLPRGTIMVQSHCMEFGYG